MATRRRRFLQSAAGVAAGLALPRNSQAELPSTGASPPASQEQTTLPQIRLGDYRVSRLIIGGNPFYGYSHFNRLFSQHMMEWSTPERVCEVLRRCEQNGINTWQFSHTERTLSDLKRHRAEGGRMQWILLSHPEIEKDHSLIREVVQLKPIGIAHHGGSAERKRRAGRLGEVRDFLKAVRDSGVLVGLSLHDPTLLEQVEEENWDVDFYMTSLYYLTRTPEEFRKLLGQKPLGEVYLPEDPPRMCQAIRQTRKTCLAYKVLAAGRLTDSPTQIDEAFRFVFRNIKPQDAIIVGMYPRYSDQIRENAERVRRICAELGSGSAA
jgi:sirohydrochlorin ferrochelatase